MSARWERYGRGAVTFHLRSGQSVRVAVESFAYRFNDRPEWEWHPSGPDTLPMPPSREDVVAIEHHPVPEVQP